MPDFTENFDLLNFQQNKHISIVVTIDGVPDKFSNRPIFERIAYGDVGLAYGQPGIVYGGLRAVAGVRDILSLSSSMTLAQKLEPEQGKGSVSTINLSFIDKDKYMSQVVSPGVIVDEILGKNVVIELGYEEISYPEDYFTIFRGFISGVDVASGMVTIQLSDPNMKRRQPLFFSAKTKLSLLVSGSALTLPVLSTASFHQQVLGPAGGYDPAIKTYVKIEDEFIEYPATGISGNTFVTVTRGARGTTAVPHASGVPVEAYVEIEDHSMDLALKLMLSGWVGPWISGVDVRDIVYAGPLLGAIPNALIFNVDLVRTYGLVIGDYITISGSAVGGNNITVTIIDFQNINNDQENYIALCSASFTQETPSPAVAAFRSQYDTYPASCGLKLDPREVDVQGHLDIKSLFLGDVENSYRFLISSSISGKSFIETEVYLPVAAYSVTRRGKCSIKMTKAPIAGAPLQILDRTTILNPANIRPSRGTNTRKFFNEIVVNLDLQDDLSTFSTQFRFLDSDSLNVIGVSSVLTINSRGAKSALAIDMTALLTRRALFLLSRYKRGATQIELKTLWKTGVKIEAGDIVGIDGDGLEITNFENGTRDFGVQLFEVVDRSMNIMEGTVSLKVINGVGSSATDRFGTISPSSFLAAGSTNIQLVITESFSAANPKFPLAEGKKWEDYVGLPIAVHNESYSFYEEVTLISLDNTNPHILNTTPLSITPPAGHVVEIARHSTSTDPTVNGLYKAVHGHLSPTVLVVTGVSVTEFTVSAPDALKFFPGSVIRVHNLDFTVDSGDVTVDSVLGVTITTKSTLGFTPTAGLLVELIGFPDGRGSYRWI